MRKLAIPILFLLFVLGSVFYFVPSLFFDGPVRADISLKPDDQDLVDLGKLVYKNNCASCHGVNLEGQERWREPDAAGYMPAPPHDETGHTWHHPDEYLFLMTKYGLEEIIGQEYPNNMPAYKDILSDEEILASLSFIKSTWSREIKLQHDKINEMNK
jgi:mono/diheme cytochrome c family protein